MALLLSCLLYRAVVLLSACPRCRAVGRCAFAACACALVLSTVLSYCCGDQLSIQLQRKLWTGVNASQPMLDAILIENLRLISQRNRASSTLLNLVAGDNKGDGYGYGAELNGSLYQSRGIVCYVGLRINPQA